MAIQDRETLNGSVEMFAPFQRDELSRLSASSHDRALRASVSQSHADAPLSGGSSRIPTEEHRKPRANGFNPGHDGQSSGNPASLEIIVAKKIKATFAGNIEGGEIGSIGVGAALETGNVISFLGAVLSFLGDTAMMAARWGLFTKNNRNNYGAFVGNIFAAMSEEDAKNRDDHRVEEEGAYGKWGRIEASELMDRAFTTAPAPSPSIPGADAGERPQSKALRRQNQGVSMPQASWDLPISRDEKRMSVATGIEGRISSTGVDVVDSGMEVEWFASAMGDYGGGIPADRRVLQVSRGSDPGWYGSMLHALLFCE